MDNKTKKGFTLIELLIVIGILAVLATIVLIVINPAQLFAEARDSQRLSDLTSLKSVITVYQSRTANPSLDNTVGGTDCATNYWGTIATTSDGVDLWGTSTAHRTWKTATATTSVDGTGWIPINLSSMAGGSPLGSLPLDPLGVSANSNTNVAHAYYYACSTTALTFKLVGKMESNRYSNGGSDDKESTDGGVNDSYFEVGTNLNNTL